MTWINTPTNGQDKHQNHIKKNVQWTNVLTSRKSIELPVDNYKEVILEAVEHHDEVIISAETGAGKSTRVPQFLYEAWYNVIVTQPRRLAATSLAKHVAHEMWCMLWDKVGYHIWWSLEENKRLSNATRIKYCTDGLQLVQQLIGSQQYNEKKTVLVIDEVHERNQNIEILIAWVKKEKQQGKKVKIVLMSATLDEEALMRFFTSTKIDEEPVSAPTPISVPGRLYPVEQEIASKHSLYSETQRLIQSQRNVLIFQPGKSEIQETINNLETLLGNTAHIFPLHGELSVEEQERIFKSYHKPVVIVSTNVAQTSVTIPYIDAVIDSWKERRIELINGIETLVLGNISQADVKQRAGRAGRCKPGIYIYCNDTPQDQLMEFPVAEIERTRLDLNYLRILVKTGYAMEDLEFIHQPSEQNILFAKQTLQKLWAIDDHNTVTHLWEQLVNLPVDVHEWCMILKAREYGVLDDVLKIAAIKEQDGIISHKFKYNVWSDCCDPDSDLLTQLSLFKKARKLMPSRDESGKSISKEKQLEWIGINPKAYFRVVEVYRNLRELFGYDVTKYTIQDLDDTSKKEKILKSITAGMLDNVWIKLSGSYQQEQYGSSRELCKNSTIDGDKILVADPKNIQFLDRRGRKWQVNILTQASQVKADWLKEFAPHLITTVEHNDQWSRREQMVIYQADTLFNNLIIKEEEKPSKVSPTSIKTFCEALAREDISTGESALQEVYANNSKILQELSDLERRTAWAIACFSKNELADYYYEILHNKAIITTERLIQYATEHSAQIVQTLTINPPQILIRDYNKILKQYPDKIVIKEKEYSVEYEKSRYYGNKIIVHIDESDSSSLSDSDFDTYFEGKKPVFCLHDSQEKKTEIKTLKEYQDKQQQQYKAEKRANFDQTENINPECKTLDQYSTNRETKKKCYDADLQLVAYLGLLKKDYENIYYEKWFKEEEDAIKSIDIFNQRYQEYILEKERLQEAEEKSRQAQREIEEEEKRIEKEYQDIVDAGNIPDHIIQLFYNKRDLIQFIANIERINPDKLDPNELCCGRSRASDAIYTAFEWEWSFCNADINDVKYFIYQIFFDEENNYFDREDNRNNTIENDNNQTKNEENPIENITDLADLLSSKFNNVSIDKKKKR